MLTTGAVCADLHFFHCQLSTVHCIFYFQKKIKNAFRPLGTKGSTSVVPPKLISVKRKPSLCICYADNTCGSNSHTTFFRRLRSVFHKSFRYRTFTLHRLSAKKISNYSLHQSKIYYTIYYNLFFANVNIFSQKNRMKYYLMQE